jgi:hypothetical protein
MENTTLIPLPSLSSPNNLFSGGESGGNNEGEHTPFPFLSRDNFIKDGFEDWHSPVYLHSIHSRINSNTSIRGSDRPKGVSYQLKRRKSTKSSSFRIIISLISNPTSSSLVITSSVIWRPTPTPKTVLFSNLLSLSHQTRQRTAASCLVGRFNCFPNLFQGKDHQDHQDQPLSNKQDEGV